MTTVWNGLMDLSRGDPIPWQKVDDKAGPCLAYYLFRDLYLDALHISVDLKRGARIDVPVHSTYRSEDIQAAAEMLSDLGAGCGIQFVCFTTRGAAFVKL